MPRKTKTAAPDPAATDDASQRARNGATNRRDPNDPAAVVGIGASAGGIAVLQQFFGNMAPDSGLAFVVVMHLAPNFESNLANIIQMKTAMPVLQVMEPVKVERNHVYVIPPNKQLSIEDSTLRLTEPQQALGRRVTIDLFFRTLAQSYGQRSVCVILSGSDSDGVIGLKHIRAQGGVTMAQDPTEAEHDSMPLTAINTGMVDWVLPVAQMPGKLLEFVRNENRMRLPPEMPEAGEAGAKDEEAPGGETVSPETRDSSDEAALQEVLVYLRGQTGHDFKHYKRATVLRRVARRLQVNSLERIPQYLEFIRTHPAEARALLQDLLIGVTHFFRDQESFAVLEANIPQLFGGRKADDHIRVWVAGCATGEEAYSVAMLLCEYAARLESPPSIQVFATDIDEQAIQEARDGLYPSTIEADISPDRLRQFFNREQGRFRVRKFLREKVLFASHNLLKDAPFSRLDLVSCRNLLIYLNLKAQAQVFDIFHFTLGNGGLLFLGGSETADPGRVLFAAVDSKHRLFVRRALPRPAWKVPLLPINAPVALPLPLIRQRGRGLPALLRPAVEAAVASNPETNYAGHERRAALYGELHLKLLEQYGPPSVVVNEAHDIVHLSEHAGRYLHFVAGEPSANLIKVVHSSLRTELRTALFRAAQGKENVTLPALTVEIDGVAEVIDVHVRPIHPHDAAHGFYLILFERRTDGVMPAPAELQHEAVNRELDGEVEFLKERLSATVEQYETSNEELKASNEELQALNEEMRSAAEELETSKEELQSVNEELTTVNHQLKGSVEELSRTNSDLRNLMGSTDIGTIFLGRDLNVKLFTPSAQSIFNLLPADIGRPLSDITHKLVYPELQRDAEAVLAGQAAIEREILGENGSWLLTRIGPYHGNEDRIAGVVATFIDISRRKRAEDELRESEERFRQFADNSADVFWIVDARTQRLEYVNPVYEKIWGKPRRPETATGVHWIELVHPEDRARAADGIARMLAGETLSIEYRIIRPNDHQVRWIRDTGFPIRDAAGQLHRVAGVTQDITEGRSRAGELRSTEERFRLLVEGARDYAMFLLDRNGLITFWSAGAERVFGWSQDEAIGHSGEMIFTPEDRAKGAVEQEIETARAKGRASDRRFHLRKDDSRFWADGVLMRLDDEQGGLRGFAKVARDASDQRAIEDALVHARDELEQRVLERTRDLSATNAELGRTMSQRQQLEKELLEISEREKRRIGEDLHDMVCQELTATALFLRSSAKKLATESPAAAETLEESAQIVNRNVGLTRDLARGLQPAELKGAGLKQALRSLAEQACETSGMKCHFKAARGTRVTDDTIALHLYRIAQEAVKNAVKHSGAQNILITLDRNSEHVCVSVDDDGIGFPTRRRSKGLGLHIMRYRANALGGELKIEKRKRGGTSVTCIIPLKG